MQSGMIEDEGRVVLLLIILYGIKIERRDLTIGIGHIMEASPFFRYSTASLSSLSCNCSLWI